MSYRKGFTQIEAVMVVVACVVIAGILFWTIGRHSRVHTHRRTSHISTQVKGIHSGMILYAQGNKEVYPGLDSEWNEAGPTVPGVTTVGSGNRTGFDPATRYAILLNGNFFTPEFAISPVEVKQPAVPDRDINSDNFSYAMLRIDGPPDGARKAEWRYTQNANAVIVSDRNLGNAGGDQARSIHYGLDHAWFGGYATNDR